MSKVLTPNRLVALAAVATGLAAFIAGLVKVFPTKYSDLILSVAGVFGVGAVALKFMSGSQLFDQTPAGQLAEAVRTGVTPTVAIPGTELVATAPAEGNPNIGVPVGPDLEPILDDTMDELPETAMPPDETPPTGADPVEPVAIDEPGAE